MKKKQTLTKNFPGDDIKRQESYIYGYLIKKMKNIQSKVS